MIELIPLVSGIILIIVLKVMQKNYWRKNNVRKIAIVPAMLCKTQKRKWFGETYYKGYYQYGPPSHPCRYTTKTKNFPQKAIGVKCLRPAKRMSKTSLYKIQNTLTILSGMLIFVILKTALNL